MKLNCRRRFRLKGLLYWLSKSIWNCMPMCVFIYIKVGVSLQDFEYFYTCIFGIFIGYSQSETFSIQLHFGFGELKCCK